MRKISMTGTVDLKSYEEYALIRIKDGDTKLEFKEPVSKRPAYSPEQQIRIIKCNEFLIKNGQDKMTDDEVSYFVDPMPTEEPTSEEIQALAGFQVEKKIIYTGE